MYVVNNEDVLIRIVSCEVEVKIFCIVSFCECRDDIEFCGGECSKAVCRYPIIIFFMFHGR